MSQDFRRVTGADVNAVDPDPLGLARAIGERDPAAVELLDRETLEAEPLGGPGGGGRIDAGDEDPPDARQQAIPVGGSEQLAGAAGRHVRARREPVAVEPAEMDPGVADVHREDHGRRPRAGRLTC